MKKAQREVYLALTSEVDYCLCSFCKAAEFSGSCCDGEVSCRHPVMKDKRWADLEPNEDCWAFRPTLPIAIMADIVGIILEKGWGTATWWENEDGRYEVAGAK